MDQEQREKQIKSNENSILKNKKISNKLDFTQQIQSKFDINQINNLIHHIKNLQNYYKYISIEIRHQEKSIATLPSSILDQFPQLKQRIKQLIIKAKFNVQFLDFVLFPYKSMVLESIKEQKNKMVNEKQHSHNHEQTSHKTISNMFYHLVRQWGQNCQIAYIHKTISYIRQFYCGQSSNQYQSNSRILVVGSGMGRILHQLKKQFKNIYIQGHQADPQLYLCSQYLLNRCIRTHSIYPYIHNFSNFIKESDPYRPVTIPQILDNHSQEYIITLGNFISSYKSHLEQWNIIITAFDNYNIENILTNIKIIYKLLKQNGIWIDISTSNLDKNIIPFTYRQYQYILHNSQFQLLQKQSDHQLWYRDQQSIINQKRTTYYRVMKK